MKWFSREKGWGFLRRENGEEIFVHHSDIEGEGHVTLADDEEVEFGVEEMEKGPRAREVRRPGQAPSAGPRPAASTNAAGGGRGRERREPSRREPSRREPEPATAAAGAASPAAPARAAESGGDPPPLDRGLRQRLGDRFPIFRDRG